MSERSTEVWLTVVGDGRARDVAVTAPSSTPLTVVLDELGRFAGAEAGAVHVARTRSVAEGDVAWATVLAHGDVIEMGGARRKPASRPIDGAAVELVVVGGPAVGQRIPLRAGPHVLGRADEADVTLGDAAVSRAHARLDVEGPDVLVTDLGSRNGTFIEGQALTTPQQLRPGQVLEVGSTLLMVESPSAPGSGRHDLVIGGRIRFNRPPRLEAPYRPPTFTLPAPPREPAVRRVPVGSALIPLALGLVLFALTQRPESLLFALLSPAMAMFSVVDDRRSGRRTFRTEAAEFRARVDEVAMQVVEARRVEAEARRAAHPDLAELVSRAIERDDRLWQRRPDDPDHLEVRIGAADQASMVTLQIAAGGSEELRAEAADATNTAATIASLPVVVALRRDSPLGIVGPRALTGALARSLVTQLAALHAPADLAVAIATSPDGEDSWRWCRWLPHSRPDGTGMPFPLLASGTAEVAELAGGLRERPSARPAVAVVVDGGGDLALWSPLLDTAAERGWVVIWLADRRPDLPNQCRTVVECREGSARLILAGEGDVDDIVVDGLAVDAAERTARALAPLAPASGAGAGSVPRRVGLLETVGIEKDGVGKIERRWAVASFGTDGAIGRSATENFKLDLDRENPHALVAGSTQTGKSELLQSWIASLAASHPPDQLIFLLVDFKGEAASRVVKRLPHVVGVVTDLDRELARRALVSLDAELRRREHLLKGDAQSLDELVSKRPDLAPPRLVIVVDEFAVLKRQLPEGDERIIDLAQRGASLGIHLVLATQQPAGVVSKGILANIGLRVCLRVVNPDDSQNVIDVDDAARLPPIPGRALVRKGGGQLQEIQVAHGGRGMATAEAAGAIQVHELGFSGPLYAVKPMKSVETELDRLVATVCAVGERTGRRAPPAPWLPPLPEVLDLGDLPTGTHDHRAVIGLVDRPAEQRQDPLVLDLARDGNAVVYGGVRSGKSTALRTTAAALASSATPENVHIYALDFGSGGLAGLDSLPHCGAVVRAGEDERTRRLIRQLRALVTARRTLLSDAGASSFDDLRTRTGATVPRVVLLIDDYGGFVAAYERVDLGEMLEAVPRLVADGPGVGVHVVLSADRRGAVPTALHGTITRRVVLPLANPDEYSALGVHARAAAPSRPPGRALIDGDHEAQIAVIGGVPEAGSQADALRALGEALRQRHPANVVPGIVPLPGQVHLDDLPTGPGCLAASIAIGDDALELVTVDLTDGHLLVTGPHRSGRTTTLAALAVQLQRAPSPAELVLLSPRRSVLPEVVDFARVAIGEECQGLAGTLAAEVELRSDDGSERPLVIFVDDLEELFDTPASTALERLARRGRDREVRVVGASEARAAHKAFGGVLPELRKSRRGVLLMPDLDLDGDLVGFRLPRRVGVPLVPGRGFFVDRGHAEIVQIGTP